MITEGLEQSAEKRNPFNKPKSTKDNRTDYNPARGRYKTNLRDQLVERNPMHIIPLEIVAYVKHLYANMHTWSVITQKTVCKYPDMSGYGERKFISIYENNREEFKEARESRAKELSIEFNSDREAIFNKALSNEVKLVAVIEDNIDRIKTSLETLDPVEDCKTYTSLLKSLNDLHKKQAELTNTDAFRRLEMNKRLLEQKREILGLASINGDDEPKEVSVNIIGE